LPKLYEELGEISEALNEHEEQHLQEERGDLMFSAMNLIRTQDIGLVIF
jgi:NTP pyrophosphatase (non-canonical NTP hydrolase)